MVIIEVFVGLKSCSLS